MRADCRLVRAAALGLAALPLLVSLAAAAAPRVEIHGGPMSRRDVEALFADALRAPLDTLVLERSLGALCARLEDAGYLDARAEGRWEPAAAGAPAASSAPVLRLDVREGSRYRIARLDFEALAGDSSGIAAAFPVHAGDWASPGALATGADAALRTLADAGYPYAQIAVTGFDWDSAGARVRVSGGGGPRVTITGVDIQGLRTTRSAFAERTLGRAVGHPYDPAAAEAGRERLLQLGLFRQVSWEGLAGEPDWGRARLQYRVEELRYNQFEGVLGSRAGGGTSGLLRFDLGNLAGTGRVVGARWEGRGQGSQLLAARYVEPLLLGAPLRIEAMVEQQREDTLFTRERLGATLQFLLSGRERVEAGFEQDHVLDPRPGVSEADLQSTTFGLQRDTRDPPLVPRAGSLVRIAASQTFKSEHLSETERDKARSSAIESRIEWYRPTGGRLGLAWQVAVAGRFSSQPVLSDFERYPLGGAATLRGFDEQAFRVDRYGLSRAEARWFPGRASQHVALFWDHAWTFTRVPTDTGTRADTRQRDAFGFGLRFEGPTGLIGVDYGLEAGHTPSEGKLHLQLVSSF